MPREPLPHQRTGLEFLAPRPRAYLADEAGLGKTYTLLADAAAQGARQILTVAPAAIRDMGIWPDEVAASGLDVDVHVVSYHGLRAEEARGEEYDAVLFDEAHRLKNRKSSWYPAAEKITRRTGLVRLASGTPQPNDATELWAPMRLIRPDLPSYWNWVGEWFNVIPTQYSMYGVDGTLKACTRDCPPEGCEHWDAFTRANLEGWMLTRRRDDVLGGLPPMAGMDQPIRAALDATQKKVYRDLKKDMLAELGDGLTIEALTYSERFNQLCQLTTGLSSVDPELDPEDRHSGKWAATAELLEDRSSPTIVGVYFRNSAAAAIRLCERLGVGYAAVGGSTPAKQRAASVRDFQAGKVDVLIASVSVIGEGVTLTAADELILVERPWTPSAMEQVVRRIHRIGQTRPVTVRQLVVPKTVDELQWKVLWEKDAAARRALAGTIRDY